MFKRLLLLMLCLLIMPVVLANTPTIPTILLPLEDTIRLSNTTLLVCNGSASNDTIFTQFTTLETPACTTDCYLNDSNLIWDTTDNHNEAWGVKIETNNYDLNITKCWKKDGNTAET